MMMLSSTLRAAAANMFSPSKNACMVAVTPTVSGARRYRHDPYRASVLASVASPEKVSAPTVIEQHQPQYFVPALPHQQYVPMRQVAPMVPAAQAFTASRPAARQAPMVRTPPPPPAPATAPVVSYATVRFKYTTATYKSEVPVRVGEQVIVEGDRGVNLGTVSAVTETKPSFPVPSNVIRVADAKDKDIHASLRHKEATATRRVSELAEAHAPLMKIVDSEFQLDSNKLTVFYTSKRMVDFRQLQRALFREYKIRVWLLNWNEIRHN